MSWFKSAARAAALAAVTGSIACGSSSSPTVTAPTYDSFTDSFSDGVLQQGANINIPDFGPVDAPHRFTIHNGTSTFPGTLTVTLNSLSPLSTITVGIGLTTWNTTNQNCDLPLQLTTSAALVGNSFSAQVGAPGDICVGVFDVGNVLGSSAYTLTVVHN